MEWKVVGRSDEIGSITRTLRKRGSVVLYGQAGVGKTRLAQEVAGRIDAQVYWIRATETTQEVPFEALTADRIELQERSTLPAVLAGYKAMLGDDPRRRNVIIVDDAHHLDPASTTALRLLVEHRACSLVATVRTEADVPDGVAGFWIDGLADRLDIAPLDRTHSNQMCELVLEAAVDEKTSRRLYELSAGRPLDLREVARAAVESGAVELHDGRWTLVSDIAPTARVTDLIERRLAGLTEDQRRVAEIVAYAGVNEVRLLLQVSEVEPIEALERSGVLTPLLGTGNGVQLAHPLYAEVLRHNLPAARRATLAQRLADAAAGYDVSPLTLARWKMDAGTASAADLADAGRLAYSSMAFELAERFGRASLAIEDSYRARTVVAASLGEQGETDAATEHFSHAHPLAPDPLHAAWTVFGSAWYRFPDEPGQAIEMVEKEIAIADDRAITLDLGAGLSLLNALQGRTQHARDRAIRILEHADASPQAGLMAAVAVATSALAMLDTGAVRAVEQRAIAHLDGGRSQLPNACDFLAGALVRADIWDCSLTSARERVATLRESSSDYAFVQLLEGEVALAGGDAALADRLLRASIAGLSTSDPTFSLPGAQLLASEAAAAAGPGPVAKQPGRPGGPADSPSVRYSQARAACWQAVSAGGSLDAAVQRCIAMGDASAAEGQNRDAAASWHLAVRLDRPERAAPRLQELYESTRSPLVGLMARHALGAADGSAEIMVDAADGFARAGFLLLAAEALAQASAVQRSDARRSDAQRTAARAKLLLADMAAHTPALSHLIDAPGLTARERDVARAAARGATSRAIADELGLSARTVDNHLGSVYAKLGVSGRTELAAVFDDPTVD